VKFNILKLCQKNYASSFYPKLAVEGSFLQMCPDCYSSLLQSIVGSVRPFSVKAIRLVRRTAAALPIEIKSDEIETEIDFGSAHNHVFQFPTD